MFFVEDSLVFNETCEVSEGGGHLTVGKFDFGKYHFWLA